MLGAASSGSSSWHGDYSSCLVHPLVTGMVELALFFSTEHYPLTAGIDLELFFSLGASSGSWHGNSLCHLKLLNSWKTNSSHLQSRHKQSEARIEDQ